jgi:hypothetical protein
MKTDRYIKDVVVAAIRRHSMDMDAWPGTRLWDEGESELKSGFSLACELSLGELPILYSYVDPANWTLVTTRRIWSSGGGQVAYMAASDVIEHRAGNFKGFGMQTSERMQLISRTGETHYCPFGTGKQSMGAIHAVRTLVTLSKEK